MSYCVNCGVELEKTIKQCPLCGTEVKNPNQPVDTISPKPYPANRANLNPTDRKETALLISLILVSPSIACAIMNFLIFGTGTWSLHVIGICTILWTIIVPPLLFRKMPKLLGIVLDAAVILAYIYIFVIQLGDTTGWYREIAVPIVVLLAFLMLILMGIYDYYRPPIIVNFMSLLGAIGIFCMGIEAAIGLHFYNEIRFVWSAVVMICCLLIIIPLGIVVARPKMREEVRRRLHM